MSHNIRKIELNFKKYNKLLFVVIDNGELKITGFFGVVSFKIPENIHLIADHGVITLYFKLDNLVGLKKNLKSLYYNILFGCYGTVFNHLININIKGIGYKFELNEGRLSVYSGNSLPSVFEIPSNIKTLQKKTNSVNFTSFSVLGGNYISLNNFAKKIAQISVPNRYKPIGIFFKKEL